MKGYSVRGAMSLTVLGIDPGTRVTGYGLIAVDGDRVERLDCGEIAPPGKAPFSERLYFIHQALSALYQTHKPRHTAMEKVFFGKNPEVAFKLGHVFALCFLQSREHNSRFFEYPARFVKKSVTSSGRAEKDWVRRFVRNRLSLNETPSLDVSDALAVALCHSREFHRLQIQKKILESAS